MQFFISTGIKDCFTLSVPVMDEVSSAQLRWRMQFKDLPDYKVDEQKEVAIGQIEMEPLIQTDKAWYTPGQLVRFRILRLNHRLRAILDPVRMNYFFSLFNQWPFDYHLIERLSDQSNLGWRSNGNGSRSMDQRNDSSRNSSTGNSIGCRTRSSIQDTATLNLRIE